MKKFFFLPAIIALATMLTSCNDKSEGGYSVLYTYTTVYQAADQLGGISLVTDYGKKIYLTENTSSVNLSNLTVGSRKIAGIKVVESEIEGYDYAASLFDLMAVSKGSCKTIETDEENEKVGDTPLTLLNSNYSLEMYYLNLYVGFMSDNINGANFYLVENKTYDPETTKAGYLNLELRIDSSNEDEDKSKEYFDYISFDVKSFSELLEDKKGIILKINTADEEESVKYIQITGNNILGIPETDEE